MGRLKLIAVLFATACSASAPTLPDATSARPAVAPVPTTQPVAVVVAEPPKLLPAVKAKTEPPFPALRPYTDHWGDSGLAGLARSRLAKQSKTPLVKQLFDAAGVTFPAKQLLFRAYKREGELEVWAASTARGELKHVTTYQICAASGVLGPKRREGDLQVPEGFYKIQYLWPNSNYYLSMKVNYPNHSDKIRGDKQWPGSDIMIHGSCASIGCLAMSDERIQELWAIGSPVQTTAGINVHIFPTRDRAALRAHPSFAKHEAFWDNIYAGHDMFVRDKRLPRVSVKWDGSYTFKSATGA